MDPHGSEPVLTAGAPLGQADAAVIMIHGRGASPEDILGLVPRLDRRSEFTYLAPAAANGSWYPQSFMADSSRNEPGLSSALSVIDRLIGELGARGIPTDRVMLLGFSQGACLAAEFAVRHAARYGGVIAFSGGLIGAPGTTWPLSGAFGGTPVFLGCSEADPHIPSARVDESAVVFTRMGADVTKRLYPGAGHFVNEDEMLFAQNVMDRIVRAKRTP